jgi:hypothetical protein
MEGRVQVSLVWDDAVPAISQVTAAPAVVYSNNRHVYFRIRSLLVHTSVGCICDLHVYACSWNAAAKLFGLCNGVYWLANTTQQRSGVGHLCSVLHTSQ